METEEKTVENEAPIEEVSESETVEGTNGEINATPQGGEITSLTARLDEQCAQIEELSLKLFEAKTRLALLLSGIAKEKLDESAALAAVLCKSGKTPEEAAVEIVGAYPHLKAVQREIPQFAASVAGADDGFSAIRGIFAKR